MGQFGHGGILVILDAALLRSRIVWNGNWFSDPGSPLALWPG
jgi:hypothetical protein